MRPAVLGAPLLAACLCSSCVPWTVRPIESKDQQKPQERFQAAAYVDSIWASRVVPTVLHAAVDLRTVLAERAAGGHFMVKGEGKVLSVDAAGQARRFSLDLLPCDGRADAAIQIGPVIRGSSLRDAVGFIHFSQFVNQIDFADVANELNARVARQVLPALEASSLKGRTVSFYGTFSAEAGVLPQIVPVKLDFSPQAK